MSQIMSVTAIILAMMCVVAWEKKRLPKKHFNCMLWVILIVYIVGNLYCTLFSRVPGSATMIELKPFMSIVRVFTNPVVAVGEGAGFFGWFMQGTFPLTGIILNILLYLPLGYLLAILFPSLRIRKILLIGCLCSIATEAIQYLLKIGCCETDDVIYNTLGTAIGVWVWLWQTKRLDVQTIDNPGKGET